MASEAYVYAFGANEAAVDVVETIVPHTRIHQSEETSIAGVAGERISRTSEAHLGLARVSGKEKPDVGRKLSDLTKVHPKDEDDGYHLAAAGSRSAGLDKLVLSRCPPLASPLSYMPSDRPVACDTNDRYLASALFCQKKSSRPKLVVLLLSAARNYLQRQTARSNWLRSRFLMTPDFVSKSAWAYAFVVGIPRRDLGSQDLIERNLQAEACHYKDILRVDVQEGYYNLTWKKVEAFKYLIQSALDFEVVLKTDDDCYVNMQLVLEWLPEAAKQSYQSLQSRGRNRKLFYSGHCPPRGYPSRNPRSKWSVSTRDYNNTAYPAFCFGAGYFMSRDLLDAIVSLPDLKRTFRLEDVHTGILVNDTGLLSGSSSITQALRVYNFPVGECGWRGEKKYPLISSGGHCEYRLRVFHAFMNQDKC